ncbi:hypothetical protein CRG98_042857 [Punica granatum]|uniref:Uncharacterized protein n=1 Tax=Punica granatum TaxID=22663 RepID=A0A2I0HYH8_PUNGR|nr:hypothetical protein CRG98_042857 [Punica granatum]
MVVVASQVRQLDTHGQYNHTSSGSHRMNGRWEPDAVTGIHPQGEITSDLRRRRQRESGGRSRALSARRRPRLAYVVGDLAWEVWPASDRKSSGSPPTLSLSAMFEVTSDLALGVDVGNGVGLLGWENPVSSPSHF